MVAKEKKVAYFTHLTECLNKYQRAFIVHADFVGSKQISDIRIALRGKAELVFGKNTMVRRCIRDLTSDGSHPEWAAIVPVMKGNLGFMFTNGDLGELQTVVDEYVKPAAAKAGVIAPCECIVPKGATGLDPAQTSFFQALNIATKINKGSIEIINDCKVLFEGVKVGTSEAALLTPHRSLSPSLLAADPHFCTTNDDGPFRAHLRCAHLNRGRGHCDLLLRVPGRQRGERAGGYAPSWHRQALAEVRGRSGPHVCN